jgi:hypothetical protein
VVDALLDVAGWTLRYLVVDTEHCLGVGRVLIALPAVVPALEHVPAPRPCFAVALSRGQVMAAAHELAAAHGSANPSVHSCRRMLGGEVHASDGSIGRLQDLIFDDKTWAARYLVVDMRLGWPGGRRVFIDAALICGVQARTHDLEVTLTRAQVKASPAFEDMRSIAPLTQRAGHGRDAAGGGTHPGRWSRELEFVTVRT